MYGSHLRKGITPGMTIFNNEITEMLWPKGYMNDDGEIRLRFICDVCESVNFVGLDSVDELVKREQWFGRCHDCGRRIWIVN